MKVTPIHPSGSMFAALDLKSTLDNDVVEDETSLTDAGVGSTRVIEEPKSSSRQRKRNYISYVYIFRDFNYLNVVLLKYFRFILHVYTFSYFCICRATCDNEM